MARLSHSRRVVIEFFFHFQCFIHRHNNCSKKMLAMNKSYWVLWALVAMACGCSSAGSMGAEGDYGYKADAGSSKPWANSGGAGGSWNAGINTGGGGGTSTSLPPEQEQTVDFLTPRAGARYVYVANPTRNTVTVIDSSTLAIEELATGDTPTHVATVPGKDIALVINAGSHTLRILRATGMDTSAFNIIPKANAISISPDGLHAVIWYDASLVTLSSPGASIGSTQEVSLVDLAEGGDKVVSVSVGYRPSTVVFSSDNAAAFVVTEDGISELRFADIKSPTIAPFTRIDNGTVTLLHQDAGVPMPVIPDSGPASGDTTPVTIDLGARPIDGEAPLDGGETSLDGGGTTMDTVPEKKDGNGFQDARTVPVPTPTGTGKPIDVSVTPKGDFAIARREGSAEVLLVDLKARNVTSVELTSEVTDLDLVDMPPAGPQAFAVLRNESTLIRIDIPAGFTDTTRRKAWPFAGATIGSVTISSNSKFALLYTTATSSNGLAIFDLNLEQVTPVPNVHKAIRAVAIAPDEKTALVLHNRTVTSQTSTTPTEQEVLDRSYGYTMIDLASGYAKLVITSADPNPFTITPDSSYAFVLLRDDKASVRIAQRISLSSFLTTDFLLGSPPNSIAALADTTHKIFVGQVHSEGRISFIDWVSGSVASVTGFALNGRIQQ
jgi:hypothetical protein